MIILNFKYVITNDSLGGYAFKTKKDYKNKIKEWIRLGAIDSEDEVHIYTRDVYLNLMLENESSLIYTFTFDNKKI